MNRFIMGRKRQSVSSRRITSLVILVLLLVSGGCGNAWKAPVERRSGNQGEAITGSWYRVRSGDTLYGIAWRAGKDYKQVAAWNSISAPYTIYTGQNLRIVAPTQGTGTGRAQSSVKAPAKTPGTAGIKSHTSNHQKSTDQNIYSATSRTPARGATGSGWNWPTRGKILSSFSSADPARKGIKIAGRRGQQILAAETGQVVYSGSGLVGYGELIIIKHNNDYLSAYGYNDKRLVVEGQNVERGAVIARMGTSGGRAQLHFEIRRRGKPVDPLPLLPGR
ncbi:MAG: peptidoglycan DD-metalloendopeptidase family protein [Pseudomonadota bacterium]